MKNIAINLNYRGIDYISDYHDYTMIEEKTLENMCERISKGECDNISFKGCNKKYYFPKAVLDKAIITLVYKYTDDNE